MKMCLLSLLLWILTASSISAQVDANAIGLRFGGGDNSGVEISYQRGLNDINRLELDMGFGVSSGYDQFKISGIYHWVFNIQEGFGWYVGPGVSFGFYSYNNGYNNNNGDFYIEAMGQIGMQYVFDFPLQLTLDFRPAIELVPDLGNLHGSIGLGARYVF